MTSLWIGPESEMATAESSQWRLSGAKVEIKHLLPGEWRTVRDNFGSEYLCKFDCVIVANDTKLFCDVIRNFKGRVILRHYGEYSSVYETLLLCCGRGVLEYRNSAHFVFTNPVVLEREPAWIKQRSMILPLGGLNVLSPWVGSWNGGSSGKILVPTPIAKHDAHLDRLDRFLAHTCVAPFYLSRPSSLTAGSGIVRRQDNASREGAECLAQSAGMFYADANLFGLALVAIEALLIGTPIVYFSDSMLALLMGAGGPGEARSVGEAHRLCERLAQGDLDLSKKIRAAQSSILADHDPQKNTILFIQKLNDLASGKFDRKSVRSTQIAMALDGPMNQALRLLSDVLIGISKPKLDDATINLLIDTCYNLILMRNPDREGLKNHMDHMRKGVSFDQILGAFLQSEEGAATRNNNEFFDWLYR